MSDLSALRERYQRKVADQHTVILGCDASLTGADGATRLSLLIVRDRANTTLEACEAILEALKSPGRVALAEAQLRSCRYAMLRDLWEEARRRIAEVMESDTRAHEAQTET